ncbi:outer membrane lipoprotein-sorting protein [Haloferula sp. BvORR071]|uniref:outer membrane lipoprotein-sorting protein n=1 Tax=Haloferula sp. BvORR071 TaxID=1396141 RepID=UPI00054D0A04|nr:outer membrane lipoprotein-sorting protein [Haloferula sp. BvORR071]
MKAFLAAATLFAAVAPLHAQAPDADALIRSIRLSATVQKMDLNGVIHKDGSKDVGISMFVREGNNLQFSLGNGERFHIRMGDENCELLTIDGDNKTSRFPVAKLATPIAGTDVTYEDLTLRFLYWQGAKLEGEEKVNGADCYRIALTNPGKDGAFGKVYVWVHKSYGAFWQVRAHDRAGNPIKEFQVNSVMQVPGGKGYTVKEMLVKTLEDKGGEYRTTSRTAIKFNDDGAKAPKGLRK